MGLADLHIHTIYSWDGTSTVSAVLKQVVEHTELDLIAITDHDEIRGAYEALDLASAYGIEIIPGCEISTADGHLLALFIQQRVPPGLTLRETVLRVGDQGGVCIAAHPSARGANSLSPAAIRTALSEPDVSHVLVGIEAYNAGLVHQGSNGIAQALAAELPVAQVGNSDAHLLWMIGRGATEFSGRTAADLRVALETHRTVAITGATYNPARLVGDWLSRYLLRKAGWVAWNAGPDSPIRLGHLSLPALK
jgi:predicted metal-dependent phosphoesterase TrpH